MEVGYLFDNRAIVGKNLLEIMKSKGYTKIAFAKKVDISRPTLNALFNGEITSQTTFGTHIEKILNALDIDKEELLLSSDGQIAEETVLYSNTAPDNYQLSKQSEELFEVLDNFLNLCDLYY